MKTHKAAVALVAVAFAVGMASMAVAQDADDDSEFTVNVSEETMVKVNPSALSYEGISPGERLEESTDTESYTGIEIENAGSTNLDDIWADASNPAQSPFGTGDQNNYDAGNFIMGNVPGGQVVPAVDYYSAVERVEFSDSDLSYVVTDESGAEEVYYGRIRMESGDEFFYQIQQTSATVEENDNYCAETGTFRIGNDPQTIDNIGSVDFTNPSEYREWEIVDVEGDIDYGYVPNVNVTTTDSQEREFDVVTFCDGDSSANPEDSFIVWSRFNPFMGDGFDAPRGDLSRTLQNNVDLSSDSVETTVSNEGPTPDDRDDTQAVDFIVESGALTPGEHFEFSTAVEVPYGVASGEVGLGILTINVRSS